MRYAILILFISTGIINAQETKITVKDLWENYSYYANQVPGFNFMNDGVSYSIQNGNTIEAYDLRSGNKIKDIFSRDGFAFSSYTFSKDEKMIVLETESEAIYRRSSRADYYVWNREKESMTRVSNEGKQRYATLNPAGDKIAYVRANDLFVKDLNDGTELRITQDGAYNKIINGATDWVYEEEFAIAKAFQWSPDGQYLAFLRFDESNVKEFTYTTYEGALYPIYNTFKYPKAGEENAKVSVHVFDLDKNEKQEVRLKLMPDSYIPRIKWKDDNELCVTNINRHQNELNLFTVNARSGKSKLLFTEKNDCFVEIHDNLNFLEDGSFIWTSEKEGYNQIYLYAEKGKLIKKLTEGNYDVTRFYGYDPLNKKIYFQAAMDAAIQRGIYSVTLDGKLETIENRSGTCNAQFSSTYDYYVLNHSSAGHPPTYEVFQTASKETAIRAIEKNESLSDQLAIMDLSSVEFIQLDHPNVEKLNAWMLKPKDFDPNKKYPLFMYVYGGPGSQTVIDSWGGQNYMWFQMLAQNGYVVVSVDNRGTDARGEIFKKSTYLNLGGYETEDQIIAAKALSKYPYIDEDRIGIFGWSFGGYLSTNCLAKGSDVFKMAIAVAPVINWKWYDTIYTERYMRTPAENNEGYESNSPSNFASQIKGKYLLVHGLADDNVHFQNAAEMARSLVKHGIPFEEAFYPNKNHGIYGGLTRSHLYQKMTQFIYNNL